MKCRDTGLIPLLSFAAGLTLALAPVAGAAPRLVPIERVASDLEARLDGAKNGYVTLATEHREAIFIPDVRRVALNGLNVYMNGPYVKQSRGGFVSETDFETVLWPLFTEGTEIPWPTDPLVVIDPGHGGVDSGAPGRGGLHEKNLTLDLALRLEALLNGSGIRTRLTRSDDRDLPLAQRARLVQQWGGDLFVSLHFNASPNSSAHGVETYVMPAVGFASTSNGTRGDREYRGNLHDAENTRLGYFIQKALVFGTGAEDRGARRARFEVLRDAACPAVLVECGFVSNPREARLLKDPDYLARIADSLASGLFTYVNRRESGPRLISPPESAVPAPAPASPAPAPEPGNEPPDPDPAESATVPMWESPALESLPPAAKVKAEPPTALPQPAATNPATATPVEPAGPPRPLRIAPVNPDSTTNAPVPLPE